MLPVPNWPCLLLPNANESPVDESKMVCDLPHAPVTNFVPAGKPWHDESRKCQSAVMCRNVCSANSAFVTCL